MKKFIGGLAAFLAAFSLSSGETIGRTYLDIYQNSSYLIQEIPVHAEKEVIVRLPVNTDLKKLNLTVSPPDCYILQIQQVSLNPQEMEKLSRYRQQINFLKSQLKALEKQLSILDRVDINTRQKPFEFLNSYFQIYFKKLQEKSTTEELLKQTESEYTRLKKKYGKRYRFQLRCSSGERATVRLTSSPPVKSNHYYIISADTVNKKVHITGKLFLRQDSGQDLEGITLRYHTYRKTTAIEPPPPFTPPVKSKKLKGVLGITREKISYGETFSRTFFQIENVKIPDGKELILTLSKNSYPAEFSVFVDGYATATPFLKAVFKPDRFYPPSATGIFQIDGTFLGRGRVPPITEGVENQLFFGEDLFVDVSRYQIKDYTEEGFLGREKTEKRWRYIIKNRHRQFIKITVVDRIPVSHSDRIEIKPFSTLKWKSLDEKGLITWEFTLKPDEVVKFEFGFRMIKK